MKVEEVCPVKLIDILAKALKEDKKLPKPKEAAYIKTGHGRELAPENEDWYYVRAASILRKLYMEELINPEKSKYGYGVLWFARIYGGSKNNGHKPSHTVTGSKSVVRRILQSLEHIKLVSKLSDGGRKLSPEGLSFLESMANQAGQIPQAA